MTKKAWVIIAVTAAVLLQILLTPIPTGELRDGGTKTWSALTYKVVKWRRLMSDPRINGYELYEHTSVYWFPNNFKSIDELWSLEMEKLDTDTDGKTKSGHDARVDGRAIKLSRQ